MSHRQKEIMNAFGNIVILAWFLFFARYVAVMGPVHIGIYDPLERAETLTSPDAMHREVFDARQFTINLISQHDEIPVNSPIPEFAQRLTDIMTRLEQPEASTPEGFQKLREDIRNVEKPTSTLWNIMFPVIAFALVCAINLSYLIVKKSWRWIVRL